MLHISIVKMNILYSQNILYIDSFMTYIYLITEFEWLRIKIRKIFSVKIWEIQQAIQKCNIWFYPHNLAERNWCYVQEAIYIKSYVTFFYISYLHWKKFNIIFILNRALQKNQMHQIKVHHNLIGTFHSIIWITFKNWFIIFHRKRIFRQRGIELESTDCERHKSSHKRARNSPLQAYRSNNVSWTNWSWLSVYRSMPLGR